MPGAEFWNNLKEWQGPQLILAGAVVAILAIFLFLRYFFVGGKPRFEAAREDRRDAIAILQAQLAAVQGEQKAMKEREERRIIEDAWNRDYRHALANQNQILLANYEVLVFFLQDVAASWPEMPEPLRVRFARLKAPKDLLKDAPLPPPLVDHYNAHFDNPHERPA